MSFQFYSLIKPANIQEREKKTEEETEKEISKSRSGVFNRVECRSQSNFQSNVACRSRKQHTEGEVSQLTTRDSRREIFPNALHRIFEPSLVLVRMQTRYTSSSCRDFTTFLKVAQTLAVTVTGAVVVAAAAASAATVVVVLLLAVVLPDYFLQHCLFFLSLLCRICCLARRPRWR